MKHYSLTPDLIKASLSHRLPGRMAHLKMVPANRSLEPLSGQKNIKKSAVILLLYSKNNELWFYLTKRNTKLKHHPGQLSFPGGRCEQDETNPLDTALRETKEEIGIEPSCIQILGKLSELYIPVSNYLIHPFVGLLTQTPCFKINTAEVDELISLPLNAIFNDDSKRDMTVESIQGTLNVPCYFIDGQLIWGATSMMIAELEVTLKQYYAHLATHSNNVDNDLKF